MTMTAREAFQKGTDTFNAHDIDGFAECSRTTSSSRRLAGCAARGRRPASGSSAAGSAPSPTRTSRSTAFTSSTTSPSRRAHSPGRTTASSAAPRATSRQPAARQVDYIQVLRFRDGKHVLVPPDVRPAPDARATRPDAGACTRRLDPLTVDRSWPRRHPGRTPIRTQPRRSGLRAAASLTVRIAGCSFGRASNERIGVGRRPTSLLRQLCSLLGEPIFGRGESRA